MEARDSTLRQDVRTGIVEAATRLLQDKGADAVTTRAVAEAAGVRAPTLYRLFGDKDGLVDSVAEHIMAAYVARTSAAAAAANAADADPVAELRAAWRAHVEFGLTNPELYVLLGTRGRRPASAATAAGMEVLRQRVRRLAAAGLLQVAEQRALLMIHAAGTGAVLALLEVPEHERDTGLADAMLDAVVGRILVSEPTVPASTTTAVAVTFATVVPELPGLTATERALLAEWLHRSLGQLPAP